jgi:hypothetical protein
MDTDDQPQCRPAADAAPMVGVVRELGAEERRAARMSKPAGPMDGGGFAPVVEPAVGLVVGRIAGSTLRCLAVVVDAALNFAIPSAVPLHRVALPEMCRSEGA